MEETIRTEMRRGDPRIDIGDISVADGRPQPWPDDVRARITEG